MCIRKDHGLANRKLVVKFATRSFPCTHSGWHRSFTLFGTAARHDCKAAGEPGPVRDQLLDRGRDDIEPMMAVIEAIAGHR
jgi:hypothetical protein